VVRSRTPAHLDDAEGGARGVTGATGRNSEACPELAASSLGVDGWLRCG
jgi:hypothetical protein